VLSFATALLVAVFAASIFGDSEPGELAVLYVLRVIWRG
jgi:hypothetical protein